MTLAAQHPSCFARPDFPDWVHPVLVKSLRQGLRSRVFVACILWSQFSLAFLVALQAVTSGRTAHMLHLWQWADMFLVMAVMVPLWPIAFQDEDRRPESLDLIRLTRVTPAQLLLGKLFCVFTQAMLLAVSVLPYGLLGHYLGQAEVMKELEGFLWLLGSMAILAPWGIFLGTLPVGGRVLLAPLILGGLLFALGGLISIVHFDAKGLWGSWIIVALVFGLVGGGLASESYKVR